MDFFKKLFNIPIKEKAEIQKQEVNLALDDLFVHNFVNKGGKFLYCLKTGEVLEHFNSILKENNWEDVYVLDEKLMTYIDTKYIYPTKKYTSETPVISSCEHLIAENGNVLFSSNQLGSTKLVEFPQNFIVFATTSQIVKDTGEGLTGIKTNNCNNLPTNISAIKNFDVNNTDDSFLNYGNSNTKNLYLLLLEDL